MVPDTITQTDGETIWELSTPECLGTGTQVSSLAKVWSEGFPSSATTSEVTITIPPPTSTDVVEDVPEEATDIVTEEGDGSPEETEENAQDPPTGVLVSGIDRFTTEELRGFMEFLPSDLRQYEYFGGGSWMGC